MKIILKNGKVIESVKSVIDPKREEFPALQDIYPEIKEEPCDICPLADIICCRNNGFDCLVYGMFSGFYCDIDTAWKILHHLTPRQVDGGESPAK